MQRESSGHEEAIPSILDRMTLTPLLTAEEEKALTTAAQNGCADSRERLVESNIRLVMNIARSYHSRNVPLEDLVQEGVIGLMTAIQRFDPTKGFRFSTYATHWIRQSIGRAVDGKAKAIRLPTHISQSLRKVDKIRAELTQKTGHEPNDDQIAAAMGISIKRLEMLLQARQELISLDVGIGDSETNTLATIIQDESAGNPETIVINSEILEELRDVMMELTERERKIVACRLRPEVELKAARDEVGRDLRLSRERVRQLEIQAIKKLRQIAALRRLREYLS